MTLLETAEVLRRERAQCLTVFPNGRAMLVTKDGTLGLGIEQMEELLSRGQRTARFNHRDAKSTEEIERKK
jgi:hypothetical protein